MQYEYALYCIEQEFLSSKRKPDIAAIIGDVRNPARVQAVFSRFKPAVVFHAAAFKHVPLIEIDNAWGAAQNKVLRTLRPARAPRDHRREKILPLSTHK